LASLDEPTRNELVAVCFRTAERYAQRAAEDQLGAALLAHHHDIAASRPR
jgi:hypothetical protein